MKKITAIFLLILFLIINSGTTITIHWCGGKIRSVDFFALDKHSCACGMKAMSSDCCKDKTTVLKANDELARSNSFVFKIPFPKFESIIPAEFVFAFSLPTPDIASNLFHPPPCKPKVPIYLMDRVLLI